MSATSRARASGLVGRVLRYAGGSVVATGCSELTLVVLYGLLRVPPVWSTSLAWLAGAVPNYWLNRSWTWRRRGRPSLHREVLPYVGIVGVTLVLAILATRAVDEALRGGSTSSPLRVALVAASFLGVYAAMFVIRFFLFDRLFTGLETPPEPPSTTAEDGSGAFAQATGRDLEDSSGVNQQRYRAFQFELIARHCGPTVLEVGAGLGEFASQFRGLRRHVVTDVDPGCVASMARRFADRPEVEAVQLDLTQGPVAVGSRVSTVIAINVLEHIEDDEEALRALAGVVEPGGRIVLWVPGYQQLYGDFDRRVGHVRRYTPQTLRAAVAGAGLVTLDARPVNLLGGIAWWLTVRRGGVGRPRPALVRIYDRFLVPCTRFLESRFTPPFGQSVLCVAVVPR